MAWLAEIIALEDAGTTVTVTFAFADADTGRSTPEYVIQGFQSDDQIRDYAARQVSAYTLKDAITLTPGVIPAPKPDPGPTPDELKAIAFAEAKAKLAAAKQDLDLKLIDQTAYDAVLAQTVAVKP
jgi:hypothetical protein